MVNRVYKPGFTSMPAVSPGPPGTSRTAWPPSPPLACVSVTIASFAAPLHDSASISFTSGTGRQVGINVSHHAKVEDGTNRISPIRKITLSLVILGRLSETIACDSVRAGPIGQENR